MVDTHDQKINYSQSKNSPVDQILFLQKTIGNQAVQRLIKSGALQAKLRIGQPGDIYEQEADRVAEQVMRMPDVSSGKDTSVQRKCPKCRKVLTGLLGKDKKDEKLQAKETAGKTLEVTPQTEVSITALKDGGQPLPESTRAFFETRFGHDFSQVRVHTDAKAVESAKAVNALAFTVGRDVVFGEGRYAPECKEGIQKQSLKTLQGSDNEVTPEIESDINSLIGSGNPLPESSRAFFEPRFGHDFSRVRVHTDTRAAESARAVNALAYTVGANVVFGLGQYVPATLGGRRLLAHELTHTIQQEAKAPTAAQQLMSTNPEDAGEGQAQAASDAVTLGNSVSIVSQSRQQLARQDDDGNGGSPGGVTTPAPSGRPVFFCSKPIMLSFLHGKRHAFFRIGGSGPGNDTVELEHGDPCTDCYQGFPKQNEPEDRDATDAQCIAAPAITDSCLASNWNSYPIGQYCAWGPNSNTYARVIAEKCGGKGLRPPGDVPGFDDSPPMPGTFGPNPYIFSVFGVCWSPGGCDLKCYYPEPQPSPEPSPA